MRILLTRPLERCKGSAARLATLGHEPLMAPVINILAHEPLIPPTRFDAAIATSAHALTLAGAAAANWTHLPLYVVGERTALAALGRGWTQVAVVAKDSFDLATAVLARDSATVFLYLAGVPRSLNLERALDAAERQVFVAIVYEARAAATLSLEAAAALRSGGVDAVLHYSPRSAAIFVDLVRRAGLEPQAAATLHVAISERAAMPLRGFAGALRIASSPDENGLLEQLREI